MAHSPKNTELIPFHIHLAKAKSNLNNSLKNLHCFLSFYMKLESSMKWFAVLDHQRPLTLAMSVWKWRVSRPLAPPSRKEDRMLAVSKSFLLLLFSSEKTFNIWSVNLQINIRASFLNLISLSLKALKYMQNSKNEMVCCQTKTKRLFDVCLHNCWSKFFWYVCLQP